MVVVAVAGLVLTNAVVGRGHTHYRLQALLRMAVVVAVAASRVRVPRGPP
jgi:hypothetical protein